MKRKHKHTAGRWYVDGLRIKAANPVPHRRQPTDRIPSETVARVYHCEYGDYEYFPRKVALANANVLAAAPQMLEALEMVLADRMVFKGTDTLDAVRKAIADATKPVDKDQTSKIRRKPVDTANERR